MGEPELDRSQDFDAADVYDDAAVDYERISREYWSFLGKGTVTRLGLARGAAVLDAAAGTGSSAWPAAEVVGPGGRVFATDLAPRLLAFERSRGSRRGQASTTRSSS